MSGVTVIVAEIGEVPVLVAENEGMFPDPLADKPMAVLELLQVKVPPDGVVTKFVAGTVLLWHTVMFAGRVTAGTGLTVIL